MKYKKIMRDVKIGFMKHANTKELIHKNGLRFLMSRDDVTQADIARAWGVENGDVSQRVSGKIRITPDRARILTEKFGWSFPEIYAEKDISNNNFDDSLMNQCGASIEAAIKSGGREIPYTIMLMATMSLYKYVMKYRSSGKNIEPDAVHADLILEKVLNEK